MIQGQITWMGVRPAKREPMVSIDELIAFEGKGLAGDHYNKPDGDRQVTIIQAEDLALAAQTLGISGIDPTKTRRNIVVSGCDLHLPAGTLIHAGDCIFELTGPCHPCSRMDENLGKGGTNALANRSGFTAKIIRGGKLRIADPVFSVAHSD